jgi:hypothetical protein
VTQLSTTSEYGVLGVRDVDFALERLPPSPDLAELVERHRVVSWALPRGRRASVTLLPHPCVNLVLDRGNLAVAGVGRERFTYAYVGEGRVLGTKFRPGAFLPFLGEPVSSITDVTMPASRLWGSPADELAASPTGDVPALVDRVWAEVAAELGYFDQSHFIRDFTAAIGLTPVAYAQACRTQQESISA